MIRRRRHLMTCRPCHPGLTPKKAVRRRLYPIRMKRKIVLVLLLALIVIAGGWLIYSQKDRLLSKMGSQEKDSKAPVFQAKIESPAPQKITPQNRQKSVPGVKSKQAPVSTEQQPAAPPRSRSDQQDQVRRMMSSTPQTRTPGLKTTDETNIARRSATGAGGVGQRRARTTTTSATKKPRSKTTLTARSYPRFDNDKLKLQAIAYSKVAAQRIAVINDRIVREGESVEGFSINQIRPENVVVSDGTQSWQLEFGLR